MLFSLCNFSGAEIPKCIIEGVSLAMQSSSSKVPSLWHNDGLTVLTTVPGQVKIFAATESLRLLTIIDGTMEAHDALPFPFVTPGIGKTLDSFNDGSHNLLHYDFTLQRIVARSEPNGFRPLYVYVGKPGVVAFSSHLLLIRAAFRDIVVRPEGVFEQLATSACLGNTSLLKEVTRLLPSTTTTINRNGIISCHATQPCGDRQTSSLGQEELWQLVRATIIPATHNGRFIVALSGGYDSRFLALAAR